MGTLFDRIRADQARKDACKQHTFRGGKVKKLGDRHICQSCGGEFRLTDIGMYIRGFKAAGGDVNRVWPFWEGTQQ